MTALNRRSFIVGSGAIASGGLAIGLQMAAGPAAAQAVAGDEFDLRIDLDHRDPAIRQVAVDELGQRTGPQADQQRRAQAQP